MSVETGPYIFHYIIEGRVCYLTMCDRVYPKKLAYPYLEDIKNEFERTYGNQIETSARPYAFIKFEVSQMSSRLTSKSHIYPEKAKDLNHQDKTERLHKAVGGKNSLVVMFTCARRRRALSSICPPPPPVRTSVGLAATQ